MREKISEFKQGLQNPFREKRSAVATIFIFLSSFGLIILSTNIGYSFQMITNGLGGFITALKTRTIGIYLTGGLYSIITTLIYSLLIAVTIQNLITQFRAGGIKMRNLTGIGPGFLVAGCAGCGLGLLSLVGLAGVLALLPFQGELIKLIGMLLLAYYIAEVGNPEVCSISES